MWLANIKPVQVVAIGIEKSVFEFNSREEEALSPNMVLVISRNIKTKKRKYNQMKPVVYRNAESITVT